MINECPLEQGILEIMRLLVLSSDKGGGGGWGSERRPKDRVKTE
jgi:hypothetical protein